jgi:PPP family 3-phenylpropionic acid transporter
MIPSTTFPRFDRLLRSLHFAIWLPIGLFFPFITVYYRSIGLTGTQIGIIGTVGSLVAAFSSAWWGMLYDRLGKGRLLIGAVGLGASALALVIVRLHTFGELVLAVGCFSFFAGPVLPLVDSTTLKLLGERREQYGTYRFWGTVGFIITTFGGGFLFERIGLSAIFYAYPLGILLFLVVAARLPDQPAHRAEARLAGLRQMLGQPAWLLFALGVFLLWGSVIGGLMFLGVIMKEMGGSERTIGLAATIAALTELPLLRYSSSALRRLGAARLLALAMVLYTLRLFLYSSMTSVNWVLWLALLQGLTYCPFLVASVAFSFDLAPEELKATSQGLLAMTMSLANLVGVLAGGWLFDHVGRQGMYLALSGGALSSLLLFAAGRLALARRAARASQEATQG